MDVSTPMSSPTDKLAIISIQNWSSNNVPTKSFSQELVDQIYIDYLRDSCDVAALPLVAQLELSFYLEKCPILMFVTTYVLSYLWPNWTPTASYQHTMSVLVMVNTKAREGVMWGSLFVGLEVAHLCRLPQASRQVFAVYDSLVHPPRCC